MCIPAGNPWWAGSPSGLAGRTSFDNATLMHFNIQYVNVVVEGEWGWITCVENITSVLQGRADTFSVVATNAFVRTLEGWRMVAHHASPGR